MCAHMKDEMAACFCTNSNLEFNVFPQIFPGSISVDDPAGHNVGYSRGAPSIFLRLWSLDPGESVVHGCLTSFTQCFIQKPVFKYRFCHPGSLIRPLAMYY